MINRVEVDWDRKFIDYASISDYLDILLRVFDGIMAYELVINMVTNKTLLHKKICQLTGLDGGLNIYGIDEHSLVDIVFSEIVNKVFLSKSANENEGEDIYGNTIEAGIPHSMVQWVLSQDSYSQIERLEHLLHLVPPHKYSQNVLYEIFLNIISSSILYRDEPFVHLTAKFWKTMNYVWQKVLNKVSGMSIHELYDNNLKVKDYVIYQLLSYFTEVDYSEDSSYKGWLHKPIEFELHETIEIKNNAKEIVDKMIFNKDNNEPVKYEDTFSKDSTFEFFSNTLRQEIYNQPQYSPIVTDMGKYLRHISMFNDNVLGETWKMYKYEDSYIDIDMNTVIAEFFTRVRGYDAFKVMMGAELKYTKNGEGTRVLQNSEIYHHRPYVFKPISDSVDCIKINTDIEGFTNIGSAKTFYEEKLPYHLIDKKLNKRLITKGFLLGKEYEYFMNKHFGVMANFQKIVDYITEGNKDFPEIMFTGRLATKDNQNRNKHTNYYFMTEIVKEYHEIQLVQKEKNLPSKEYIDGEKL